MRLDLSRQALDDYAKLPDHIQEQTDAALKRLKENPRYPSLRVKKMKGHPGVWEARISRSYRILFEIEGDAFLILRLGPHDVEKNP